MSRIVLQRLFLLPFVVLLANLFGFAYAFYTAPRHAAMNPYSSIASEQPPFLPIYLDYVRGWLKLEFGTMPNGEPIAIAIWRAFTASSGLLLLALIFSALVGVLLGIRAVRAEPVGVARWMVVVSTIGLASPSFYTGILFVAFSVFYVIWGPGGQPLLPFRGYGRDAHLVLPTLALMALPTVKIAQVTAGMLSGELNKQYVIAARSFGHSIRSIRRRIAFRNIIVPVMLTVTGSARLLVAELIIVERLFGWPGFGRLLSTALVDASPNFLLPPLLAGLLMIIALFFMLIDLIVTILARSLDPRVGAA